MDKNRNSAPSFGVSSLMTIFSVLCLVILALLAVSTVRSQTGMAEASAASVEGYYTADAQAQGILAQLRQGAIPDGVTCKGNTYTYACAISDTQSLEVSVRISGGGYTILRWQAVSTAPWENDESLDVWTGG